MGKTSKAKSHQVILRSPLPRIHYYHNKQLQVKESQCLLPTYSWTLTPIPNWTCSVVIISPFQCTAPSTLLTNCADPVHDFNHQLEKDVGCKILQFITRWRSRSSMVTKPYGVQTQQYLHRKNESGQILSPVIICMNKLCSTLVQLVPPLTALKIIILYV